MKTNARGIALIKRWESFQPKAYKCPAGVWTIGYGHTGDVKPGMTVTEHQAEAILGLDLEKFEEGVDGLAKGLALTSNQFSALVSFSFNVGITALANSTLLKKLRKGDLKGAQAEFARWNKAGGKVLKGLTLRRADEAELFGSP